ncbi:SOS response-associated peptidase [Mycetocola zhujimingii]|uniref:SOS response-associated peptidase n=1 Tax=Mycetocola zhujimingii TaxID=2079792 RepID=UPI000D38C849|nr:SOS response-associated peptidase [Mycetocola zhujimingii]AWB86630.1 SOS response-associated peptidase [Mycetocola zhujimingii]
MCGRFAMNKDTDDLIREFMTTTGRPAPEWRPSWNVAPTDSVPVVRERSGERELDLVRWGIVSPSSPTFGGGKPIINARIETVATNGLFKSAFASHRCIVPASGYYEWQLQNGGKQPYFISGEKSDLAMAGIIRAWPDRSKDQGDPDYWRLSMAIITRDAHVAPGEVHDRMPACLTPDRFDAWLGSELAPGELLTLLDESSFDVAHELGYHPVSKAVNSVRNDGPELVEPIELDSVEL